VTLVPKPGVTAITHIDQIGAVRVSSPGYEEVEITQLSFASSMDMFGRVYMTVDVGTVCLRPTAPTQPVTPIGPFMGTTDGTGRFEVPIPTLPNTGVTGRLTECTVRPIANQSFTLTLVPKGEMVATPEDIAGFTFSVPGYRETTVTQFSRLSIFGFTWYDTGTVCLYSIGCREVELTVLSWNTNLLPTYAKFVSQRIPNVAGSVTGFDIVFLQEVFAEEGKNEIAGTWFGQKTTVTWNGQLERNKEKELNLGGAKVRLLGAMPNNEGTEIAVLRHEDRYIVAGPDSSALIEFTQDGGLMILSKYPIIAASGMIWEDQAGAEAWSSKGTLYARIQLDPTNPECYIHVFNTHLAARSPEFTGPDQEVDYKVNGTKGTVKAGQSAEVAVKPGQMVEVTASKGDTKVTLTFLDKDKKEISKVEKELKEGDSLLATSPARAAFVVIATDVKVPHPDKNWNARKTQIEELVTFISNCIRDDKVGHPIILGGDFNVIAPFPANWGGDLVVPEGVDATKAISSPQYDELMNLLAAHKLTDAWKENRGGVPGFTWLGNNWKTQPGSPWGDKGNPLATKEGWPQRLDYIFYNAGAEKSPVILRLDTIGRTHWKMAKPFQWDGTQSYVPSDHLGVIAKFNSPRCNRQVQR
jgi:endonuclease/exonuclease/phosphatase family metal-dependent hydrolase